MRATGLIVIASLALGAPAAADIISDISTSTFDEGRALGIKKERFWSSLLEAADGMNIPAHLRLCSSAEEEIALLPAENDYVRSALGEAVMRLKRANEALLKQAASSAEVAESKLVESSDANAGSSFLTGGAGGKGLGEYLSLAIKHFVGGGAYSERLTRDVSTRQADIEPMLRDTASITGSILEDCRTASRRGFDTLKYDIYNEGVPKTPKAAEDLANRLIKAAGMTRKSFMKFVTAAATGIADDYNGKKDQPSAIVVQTSLRLNRFGGTLKSFGSGGEATTTAMPELRPDRFVTEQLINL